MSKKRKNINEVELEVAEEQTLEDTTVECIEEPEKVGFFRKLGRGIKARGPKIVGIGAGVVTLGGLALMMLTDIRRNQELMALEILKSGEKEYCYEEDEDDAEDSENAESETEE